MTDSQRMLLKEAERARAAANRMSNSDNRRFMLDIASQYERLASVPPSAEIVKRRVVAGAT